MPEYMSIENETASPWRIMLLNLSFHDIVGKRLLPLGKGILDGKNVKINELMINKEDDVLWYEQK